MDVFLFKQAFKNSHESVSFEFRELLASISVLCVSTDSITFSIIAGCFLFSLGSYWLQFRCLVVSVYITPCSYLGLVYIYYNTENGEFLLLGFLTSASGIFFF